MMAFFVTYRFFLSRDTMYNRNRIFILVSVIAAFILPFISFDIRNSIDIQLFGKMLSEILISGNKGDPRMISQGFLNMNGFGLLATIYFAGVMISGLKLFIDILELIRLIGSREDKSGHIIYFQDLSSSGFSAFGYIFINKSVPPTESAEIIRHEQNHLEHGHSLDILLIETARILQWFNPFVYMFSRSLRAVHEYQADNECLMKGISVVSYQGLLLNQVFRSKSFTVTNSFSNPTLIKNRMIMMTKEPSSPLVNLKLLLVLPLIALMLFTFSACKNKALSADGNKPEITSSTPVPADGSAKVLSGSPSPSDEMAPPPPPPPPPVSDAGTQTEIQPFEQADVMPVFPGGDQAILQFIVENTRYPEGAQKIGTQGKVIVRFAIEADGSVDKISILKGTDPELDAEALRVIGKLPKFKPGLVDGKPVPVWYMVPINFTLK